MAAGDYVKFYQFVEDLAKGVHDLDTDTLKVYLTNNTPSQSLDLIKTDLVGITEGAGYGYDPADVTNSVSETSGTMTVAAVDVTWTCTAGGTIGPFRYVILYNDTATDDPLIAYWDYGSSITLNPGESFTVNFTDDKLFTLA